MNIHNNRYVIFIAPMLWCLTAMLASKSYYNIMLSIIFIFQNLVNLIVISHKKFLNFTPHQLNDLGFTWDVLLSMGGDVKTLSYFNVELEDLKTYWNPTQGQWYEAGFYDKSRVIEAGWDIEHVTRLLPELDGRLSGRTLRLQF